KVVERTKFFQVHTKVAIVAFGNRQKRVTRDGTAQHSVGLSVHVVVIPGFNHLIAGDLSPGVKNLLEPVLDFRWLDAKRASCSFKAVTLFPSLSGCVFQNAPIRTLDFISIVNCGPERLKRKEKYLAAFSIV